MGKYAYYQIVIHFIDGTKVETMVTSSEALLIMTNQVPETPFLSVGQLLVNVSQIQHIQSFGLAGCE